MFTISVLEDEPFNFDKLEKTKMRELSHFLDNDFLPCHVVTQNSVLNVIGKTGTVKRATVIKEYAYTITTRQDRTPAQVIALTGNRFRYLTERNAGDCKDSQTRTSIKQLKQIQSLKVE